MVEALGIDLKEIIFAIANFLILARRAREVYV